MRFDTPVIFQTIKTEPDPKVKGNYVDKVVAQEKRYASVTNTGIETLNIIYGEIKQGVKTVRLQNYYDKPFDRVMIGNKAYRVDRARPLRLKYTLIVSEVPSDGDA